MINFEEIRKVLPHGFPYYMVDKITNVIPRKKVVGIKNISGNEIFFLGHFPDKAIVPGTVILETMGQVGAFLFYNKKKEKINFLLGVIKDARFIRPVFPGDQLEVTVEAIRISKDNAYVHSVARVNKVQVATSDLIFVRRK